MCILKVDVEVLFNLTIHNCMIITMKWFYDRKKSFKRKNWLLTILCIAVEFVTETTADQKQMFDCLPCQFNY